MACQDEMAKGKMDQQSRRTNKNINDIRKIDLINDDEVLAFETHVEVEASNLVFK